MIVNRFNISFDEERAQYYIKLQRQLIKQLKFHGNIVYLTNKLKSEN
jgi:hypothetical protein